MDTREIQNVNATLGTISANLNVAFHGLYDHRIRRTRINGLLKRANINKAKRRQLLGELASLEAWDQQLIGKIDGINDVLYGMSQTYDFRKLAVTAVMMNGWSNLSFDILSPRQRREIEREMSEPGYLG